MSVMELDSELEKAEAEFKHSQQKLDALKQKKLDYLVRRLQAAEQALEAFKNDAPPQKVRLKGAKMTSDEAIESVFFKHS